MKHALINDDCLEYLGKVNRRWDTIFADPPDNIGRKYSSYNDKLPESEYKEKLWAWLYAFTGAANTVWFSFNAKWLPYIGHISFVLAGERKLEIKPCVQTFTFGQHNHHDLGNNYRPLWRFRNGNSPLFPEYIRVPSWRQKNGDKRADPRGRVPGDVFDFPRVTGNSGQRRKWHPTQLHEGLVERCIKLTTHTGGSVLDPFGGTGTVLRVCKRLNKPCTVIEVDSEYCTHIAAEHEMALHSVSTESRTWLIDYYHQ